MPNTTSNNFSPVDLVSQFLSPQLLAFTKKTKLDIAINDILNGVQNQIYTPSDASKIIIEVIKKATDQDNTKHMDFDHLKSLVDEGDYIQASGKMDYSQSGEPSIFVDEYEILTKALRPLPEKMDYENTESRYTDRVADFKMNTKDESGKSIRDIVRAKAKYWQIWREEMEREGFLSVECPIFENIPGGAEARPFTTFYNELSQEMYLRISLELPLKKLIAGGFEKVYEIGRIFRNEGSSPQHLQEYTQIEWYCAYQEYDWAATFVKKVYQRVVEEILECMTQKAYNGANIDWSEWCTSSEAKKHNWELITNIKDNSCGWPKIAYFDAVRHFSNGKIDTENKTDQELVDLCHKNNILDVKITDGTGTLLDKLWKKARVNTTNPFFLILPPVELEPLAKRDPQNPHLTQRWQIVAGGAELGKAFTELNDPIDQFGRFEEQQKARDNGNDEAQFMDKDYVKAMEYGMPPMAGFGTSERFVSFLLGKHIRECSIFPYIRERVDIAKNKETKVAHAVLLNNSTIPMWSLLNASAHLSASFAARQGTRLLHIDKNKTIDGVEIPMNIQHTIVIKVTDNKQNLLDLKQQAEDLGLETSCFTEEMRDSKNDEMVTEKQTKLDSKNIGWLGILVFGKKNTVENLTSNFDRYE